MIFEWVLVKYMLVYLIFVGCYYYFLYNFLVVLDFI